MAVVVLNGIVTRTGDGQYGPWYVVEEGPFPKRDGGTYTVSYMCSGKESPAEGQHVVVQGFGRAKVDEYEKNGEKRHTAKIALSAAQFTLSDPYSDDGLAGDCPF